MNLNNRDYSNFDWKKCLIEHNRIKKRGKIVLIIQIFIFTSTLTFGIFAVVFLIKNPEVIGEIIGRIINGFNSAN